MLASEVKPRRGNTDEVRVTGKKRKVRHMLPTIPRVRPIMLSLASHLQLITCKCIMNNYSHVMIELLKECYEVCLIWRVSINSSRIRKHLPLALPYFFENVHVIKEVMQVS